MRAKFELKPPKEGRSPFYRVRGTYLGQYVDRSTGTGDRKIAAKVLASIKREIESGRFSDSSAATFAGAALSYMQAGGERRFLKPLLDYFGEKPLADFTQATIDAAAASIYPRLGAASRNRLVYTPCSAILRHAGVKLDLRRPKGAQGQRRLDWFTVDQVGAILTACGDDTEWRAFLTFLLYSGCRLSEATIGLRCDRVSLEERWAHVHQTKTDTPREIRLPAVLVAELANHPRGLDRGAETVFKFRKSGALYKKFRLTLQKGGVSLPPRAAFHTFRHSYATWLRKYAGADDQALLATGAWRNARSAQRYAHISPLDEAKRVDLLPTPDTRALSGHK